MENQMKTPNLKFHGFPEKSEEGTELKIFMANWLTGKLEFEDGVALLLDCSSMVQG